MQICKFIKLFCYCFLIRLQLQRFFLLKFRPYKNPETQNFMPAFIYSICPYWLNHIYSDKTSSNLFYFCFYVGFSAVEFESSSRETVRDWLELADHRDAVAVQLPTLTETSWSSKTFRAEPRGPNSKTSSRNSEKLLSLTFTRPERERALSSSPTVEASRKLSRNEASSSFTEKISSFMKTENVGKQIPSTLKPRNNYN